MSLRARIKSITEEWFLTEPLLFGAFCSHELSENAGMRCAMRVGDGRLEVNPAIAETMSDERLRDSLRVEMLRILLKHPYQRQPYNAQREWLLLSSDVTIADNCDTAAVSANAEQLGLPQGLAFEQYYHRIATLERGSVGLGEISESTSDSQVGLGKISSAMSEQAGEGAALWAEDELMQERINREIVTARETNGWGTLPGKMIALIESTLVSRQNFRAALSRFRQTVISTRRRLTRMRPSRRYGFEAMGSRYEFSTRLLVAVDVSGSVSDDDLRVFLAVINSFFKQGIERIDVIQFDSEVKSQEPESLKRAARTLRVLGRGGTNFQPVIDYYYEHTAYDGLLVLTDGYAPEPHIPAGKTRRPMLWLLNNDRPHPDLAPLGPTLTLHTN